MSLPEEVEELLDVLRRRKLDEELAEIARIMEFIRIDEPDIRTLQFLANWILRTYHREGVQGYRERQIMCEEITRAKYGEPQRKAS